MEKETCTFSFCAKPEVTEVETDLLIMGGGMAGCGAAFEACRWANAKGLKVVLVDKAATDRSGAVAMGLSAINTYVGENKAADYVKYVRNDLMGIIREDLVFDLGRHVDDSVQLFEEWGLPIWKKGDDGKSLPYIEKVMYLDMDMDAGMAAVSAYTRSSSCMSLIVASAKAVVQLLRSLLTAQTESPSILSLPGL
jgi:succinate dehydrogenase/fumarate reductase flavoprotein subunit